MSWSDAYVGGSYEMGARGPNNFDCMGLFIHVQRDKFGRVIADHGSTQLAFSRALREGRHSWEKMDGPTDDGDALLFRLNASVLHIACAVGARHMLHCHYECGPSVEVFNTELWNNRLIGKYRHVG